MSDLFAIYDENLKGIFERIKKRIDDVNSDNLSELVNLVNQGDDIIKQMKLESLTNANKNKVNAYTNDINDYKKRTRKLQEKYNDEKNSKLFETKNEKGGLIANEEYAYSGSQKLEEAKRVLASTEDTANKIMGSMEEQNEKFKSVNVKIKGMNDSLDGSNNLMNSMQLRMNKNKRIILIFGMVLLGILALTITMKIIFQIQLL